jgi:hypothetical protein
MVRDYLLLGGICLILASGAVAAVYDCNVAEARAGAGGWAYPPHTYADSLKKLYENATTECPNYARLDEVDLWEWGAEFDPPKSWVYMLLKFEYPNELPGTPYYNFARWSSWQAEYNVVSVYRYVCTTDGGYWVYVTQNEGTPPEWPTFWTFTVLDSWYNENDAVWFMFEAETYEDITLFCDVFDIQYYY